MSKEEKSGFIFIFALNFEISSVFYLFTLEKLFAITQPDFRSVLLLEHNTALYLWLVPFYARVL